MIFPDLQNPDTAMKWGYADQSSIIRSNQKDVHYQRLLQDQIDQLLQQYFRISTQTSGQVLLNE